MNSPTERPNGDTGDAKPKGGHPAQQQAQPAQSAPPSDSDHAEPNTPATAPNTNDANENKNEPNEWRENSIERASFRVECALFVVECLGLIGLIFYCVVNWYEWKTFDSERQMMDREFKQSQTNFVAQMEESKQQRILAERAWLTPYIADNNLIFRTNGMIQVMIDVKNSGKTPAILTGYGIKETENTNDFPNLDKVNKISMMASPNADNIRLFSGLIPPKELDDLANNTPFYVYGVITYRDIFNRNHWTEFCWSVVGGDFNAAPWHNGWGDIEDNQQK